MTFYHLAAMETVVLLANSCLFPHLAVTEQHDDSLGVSVFVSPDECTSDVLSLLAVFGLYQVLREISL